MELSKEVKEKLNQLRDNHEQEVRTTLKDYALSAIKYNVGDIIEDHSDIGEIERIIITISVFSESVVVSFRCKKLTKKLEQNKVQPNCTIFESNIKRKL